jgi:hypothetical protein
MPFNKDKYLQSLLAMDLSAPPVTINPGSTPSFSQYMAAHNFGATPKNTARNLGLASQSEVDSRSAVSKTFSWMASLGNMAENVFMESSDPNQTFGESVANSLKDVAAGVGNLLNPIQEVGSELLGVPGLKTPWEPKLEELDTKIGNWLKENNTEFQGKPISGARIMEDRFGVQNKVGKHGGGFAIDVLTDPLTYIGVGFLNPNKWKSPAKALEGLAAASTSKESLEATAAVKAGAEGVKEGFVKPLKPTAVTAAATKRLPFKGVPGRYNPPEAFDQGAVQKVLDESLSRRIETAKPLSGQVTGPYLRDYERAVKVPKEYFHVDPRYDIGKLPNVEKQGVAETVGKEFADTVDPTMARDLTREEQADLFKSLTTREEAVGMTSAEQKHAFRAAENTLMEKGYTFSDGRLSEFMHNASKAGPAMKTTPVDPNNLEHFTQGVFRKEVPDMVTDPKQFARITAQKLSAHKGQVLDKHGINPFVVDEAIKGATAGFTPRVVNAVAPATGALGAKAVETAEKVASGLGKRIGQSKQIRHKELNPANQANLWNSIYKSTATMPEINTSFKGLRESEEALKWRHETSLSMLRRAEDHLAAQGKNAQHWNGTGLRLSDVIAEVGTEHQKDYLPRIMDAFRSKDPSALAKLEPDIRHIVERAIGRRAVRTGGVAKTLYDDFAKKADVAQEVMSPQKYDMWKKGEYQRTKDAAKDAGMTNKEADAVAQLVKEHTSYQDIKNLEPFQVVEALGPRLSKAVLETGKVDKQALRQVQRAINKQVGDPKGMKAWDKLQNDVPDWFAHNMTTWRGRGFMMPTYRNMAGMNQMWTKARADWFGRILMGHSSEEIHQAFKLAQDPLVGLRPTVGEYNPKVAALSSKFTDLMDNILATPHKVEVGDQIVTRSLKDLKDLDGSMAVRSQTMMHDVNKNLKALGSDFRFKADKNGEWLHHWRNADPKVLKQDPASFLYTIDQAMQNTMAEYNLVDAFAARFGKKAGDAGFDSLTHTNRVYHGRIADDIKFEGEQARTFHRLLEDMEKGNWRPGKPLTHFMTQATRRWKSAVTIYYPSHHIRNLIGDSYLMWIAGHNDPRTFTKALRILGSERKRYADAIKDPDLSKLTKMLDPNADNWVNTVGEAVISKKHGMNVKASEYYAEAMQRGLLMDASRIEDLQGNTRKVFREEREGPRGALQERLSKPFGGKVHNAASTVSEVREHYVRLAHFVSYAEKHMTPALAKRLREAEGPVARSDVMRELYDNAAKEIRKYHPDGTDMTYFEQKYARNIIPFYSWTRKAIPLTVEAIAQKPGKVLAYPRAMYAAQGMLGIQAPGPYDPFPTNQLYPDWVTAQGIGPLGDPESDNPFARFFGKLGRNQITPFGTERGYTQINPGGLGLPANSFISQYFGVEGRPGEIGAGLKSGLTPFISAPIQAVSGHTELGQEIGGGENQVSPASWLASQVPQLELGQRLTGIGKNKESWQEQGPTESLINLGTALGVQGTGKWSKSAQFDLEERMKRLGTRG